MTITPSPLSGLVPAGRIGPFRIERTLDDGGLARVFLGRDERSGAAAAVKQLKPERVTVDPHLRDRLRQEVAAAGRLPRFCAAQVLAADLDADPPWVATEYIDAPSLAQLLATRGPLAEPELEAFAVAMAVALWVVHAHGVVHQDLKPASVLLSPVGPRLLDFGIARAVGPAGGAEPARPARPPTDTGTLAYLAPEQVWGDPATPAVDVFAWAGLVTAAGTGRPPFGTRGAARRAILTAEPDLGELARPLRDVVAEALHKDPARRPPAVELVRRLAVTSPPAGSPAATTPMLTPPAIPPADPAGPPAVPPVPAAPAGWSRRKVLATLAIAAGAVATATGGTAAVRWLTRPAVAGSLLRVLPGHEEQVDSVAVGELAGETIAVSTSKFDRTTRVWHLATGDQLEQLATGPEHAFQTVAFARLGGAPVAILGGSDPISMQVWDLPSGAPVELAFTDHDGAAYQAGVSSVSVGEWDGGPVVVSGGLDRTIRMWDLRTGRQLGATVAPDTTREGLTFALAVTAGQLDGAPVAVAGGLIEPPWAAVWDLRAGAQVSSATGHVSEVNAVATGGLAGQPVVVSGGDDGAVRIWSLATGRPIGPQLTGHSRRVRSIALGQADGRPVVVSGSEDRTVRVWDPTSGAQLGPELTGHTGVVTSVAIGELAGDPIAVSTGGDATIQVWRLPSPGR